MRVSRETKTRRVEKRCGDMKELLRQISSMEQDLNKVQEQADYWLNEEHYDEEKSEKYEQHGDKIYEKLYALIEEAADQIVSITSGNVDKKTARVMIRTKREELERLFA